MAVVNIKRNAYLKPEHTGLCICFHAAGCGAQQYLTRDPSERGVPNELVEYCKQNEVALFCMDYSHEIKNFTIQNVAEIVYNEIKDDIKDVPYILCGHSMGTYIIFELLRLIKAQQALPLPHGLVLSSACSPLISFPWRVPVSDPDLREWMRGWDMQEAGLKDGVWEMFRGRIRRDLEALENYKATGGSMELKGVCVHALVGDKDTHVKEQDIDLVQQCYPQTVFTKTVIKDAGHDLFNLTHSRKIVLGAVTLMLDSMSLDACCF